MRHSFVILAVSLCCFVFSADALLNRRGTTPAIKLAPLAAAPGAASLAAAPAKATAVKIRENSAAVEQWIVSHCELISSDLKTASDITTKSEFVLLKTFTVDTYNNLNNLAAGGAAVPGEKPAVTLEKYTQLIFDSVHQKCQSLSTTHAIGTAVLAKSRQSHGAQAAPAPGFNAAALKAARDWALANCKTLLANLNSGKDIARPEFKLIKAATDNTFELAKQRNAALDYNAFSDRAVTGYRKMCTVHSPASTANTADAVNTRAKSI